MATARKNGTGSLGSPIMILEDTDPGTRENPIVIDDSLSCQKDCGTVANALPKRRICTNPAQTQTNKKRRVGHSGSKPNPQWQLISNAIGNCLPAVLISLVVQYTLPLTGFVALVYDVRGALASDSDLDSESDSDTENDLCTLLPNVVLTEYVVFPRRWEAARSLVLHLLTSVWKLQRDLPLSIELLLPHLKRLPGNIYTTFAKIIRESECPPGGSEDVWVILCDTTLCYIHSYKKHLRCGIIPLFSETRKKKSPTEYEIVVLSYIQNNHFHSRVFGGMCTQSPDMLHQLAVAAVMHCVSHFCMGFCPVHDRFPTTPIADEESSPFSLYEWRDINRKSIEAFELMKGQARICGECDALCQIIGKVIPSTDLTHVAHDQWLGDAQSHMRNDMICDELRSGKGGLSCRYYVETCKIFNGI